MKKFKGLDFPPVKHDVELIQESHCHSVEVSCGDCRECLYGSDNLEQFTEWYFNGAHRHSEIKEDETSKD